MTSKDVIDLVSDSEDDMPIVNFRKSRKRLREYDSADSEDDIPLNQLFLDAAHDSDDSDDSDDDIPLNQLFLDAAHDSDDSDDSDDDIPLNQLFLDALDDDETPRPDMPLLHFRKRPAGKSPPRSKTSATKQSPRPIDVESKKFPEIQDLPISVDVPLGRIDVDVKLFGQFTGENLPEWFDFIEEKHPGHVCVVDTNWHNGITYFHKTEKAIPERIHSLRSVYHPENDKVFIKNQRPTDMKLHIPRGTPYYKSKRGIYSFARLSPSDTAFKLEEDNMIVYMKRGKPEYRKGIHVMDMNRLKRMYNRCSSKSNVRFFVFLMVIDFEPNKKTNGISHANALIYDTKVKSLTRYEPHGGQSRSYDSGHTDECVQKVLIPQLRREIGLNVETYIASSAYCPRWGLQGIESSHSTRYPKLTKKVFGRTVLAEKGGFCDVWTAMFVHFRILNPNKSETQVYEMMNRSPDDLATMLRAYVTAIMKYFLEKSARVQLGDKRPPEWYQKMIKRMKRK